MKIDFNVPPYVGNKMTYIADVVNKRKICGDGEYTKKCNLWLEKNKSPFKDIMYSCDRDGDVVV